MSGPRYAIGIDLGTSNCALSWVKLNESDEVSSLLIPQLEAEDRLIKDKVLPSFTFIKDDGTDPIIGRYAREQVQENPAQVIQSAKSWICHGGVDRRSAILPWGFDRLAVDLKKSPVSASALYLSYLKQVWDAEFATSDLGNAFEKQLVSVTVPASFDHVAQRLTLEAADMAGFPAQTTLLEEPQAAFYDWLRNEGETGAIEKIWELNESPSILVCDIGGGTSDFSLFEIAKNPDDLSLPDIKRISVSDHILLGGDNLDLAIAFEFEKRMGSERVTHVAWQSLVSQSRIVKEHVLGDSSAESFSVSVTDSTGSNLFSSVKSAVIKRDELLDLIEEHFYPQCKSDDLPKEGVSGLHEMGLPYAADTAITRYLAEFLNGKKVDAILFNGGSMTPPRLRERIITIVESWQSFRPIEFEHTALHLAVAHGAATFAARSYLKKGNRIQAGEGHGVYLEVHIGKSDSAEHLLCVLPQGTEAGTCQRIRYPDLSLKINQPVAFRPYTSTKREKDRASNVFSRKKYPGQFRLLPELQTVARLDKKLHEKLKDDSVQIDIEAKINELGLLQIQLVTNEKSLKPSARWDLEFNLRALTNTDDTGEILSENSSGIDAENKASIISLLKSDFKPNLLKQIETQLDLKRSNWTTDLIRQMWEPLFSRITRRQIGADYEMTWLSAAGYFLRPGYGATMDDFRMDQIWDLKSLGLFNKKSKPVREQYYILWRRVSGGLSSQRQEQLFLEVIDLISSHTKQAAEAVKMAASFERLTIDWKKRLFFLLLEGFMQKKEGNCEAYLWGLARILNRTPLYAGHNASVPAAWVERAFSDMRDLDWTQDNLQGMRSLFRLAARRTNQRELDLGEYLSKEIIQKMKDSNFDEKWWSPIENYIPLQRSDEVMMFGESLPSGLSIR